MIDADNTIDQNVPGDNDNPGVDNLNNELNVSISPEAEQVIPVAATSTDVNNTSSADTVHNDSVNDSLSPDILDVDVVVDSEDSQGGDDSDHDTGGIGTGVTLPGNVLAEPGFIDRFSSHFNSLLNQENPNFTEFQSLVEDFTLCVKKELNFKTDPGHGAPRPPKVISFDDAKAIQRLYRKNRKKALRIIYDDPSDFCDLDPELVANHYNTDSTPPPDNTDFMREINPADNPMNTLPFTPSEISKRLRRCENTPLGPDGITYNHLKQI